MASRPRLINCLFFALLTAAPLPLWGQTAEPERGASFEFFEKKIRPLLVDSCYTCHSANTNAKGDLRVDDRNGLLQGGSSGPAVVPGHPEASLLIKAVSYEDADLKMPPKKHLSSEQVADLTKWIQDGAVWPAAATSMATELSNAKYEKLRKEHWAWQPLGTASPPQPRSTSWARSEVDRFILARLEDQQLKPVGDAEPMALIRRLTFDLTGLPPTLDETDAFVADHSDAALERAVDRLLASPAFGERWGRHWLDVARYGESTGSSRNVPFPHAWRYRDYVIDAFHNDKPYDQFVREQIAGDLLPSDSQEQRDEHQIATGFLALGVKDVNQRFRVRFIMDNIDEQIDAVSKALLATTASCARCHDHKFDPIPTADYYALAGIFHSTDLCAGLRNKMGGGGMAFYDTQMLLPLGPERPAAEEIPKQESPKIEQAKQALAEARAEFQALAKSPEGDAKGPDGRPKRQIARQKMNRLQNELEGLNDPAVAGKVAMGVREGKLVGDTEIRIRGEAEKLGPVVPRGFLSVLQLPDQPAVNPSQSGRLELAQWLTSEKNPLTPRVMANRVWQHLFGQGLVRSVDNFGANGDIPSHPELLDYLASQFVRDRWSVKKLVRSLVLSRAYGLSSEATPGNLDVDPANRFVWRHSPRWLDAEEIRDATLIATDKLDRTRPVASPAAEMKVMELSDTSPLARRLSDEGRASQHRSVYLPLLRNLTPMSLEVFDFAEQGMVTGSRDTTTVATQALYLLNDEFVRRQSLTLAERLLRRTELDDAGRIGWAYRLTMGRPASIKEIDRVVGYLNDYESAARQLMPASPRDVKQQPATELASSKIPSASSGSNAPVADASASGAAKSDSPDGSLDKTAENGAKRVPARRGKPAAPQNPDEVVSVDEPLREVSLQPTDPKTAAWTSFCQALLGTAEFRYIK